MKNFKKSTIDNSANIYSNLSVVTYNTRHTCNFRYILIYIWLNVISQLIIFNPFHNRVKILPYWASPDGKDAKMVKNLSAMWETQVQSLSWKDPLEKGMATHYGILTWKIPWAEEPAVLWPMESQIVRHKWATNIHIHCHINLKYI